MRSDEEDVVYVYEYVDDSKQPLKIDHCGITIYTKAPTNLCPIVFFGLFRSLFMRFVQTKKDMNAAKTISSLKLIPADAIVVSKITEQSN